MKWFDVRKILPNNEEEVMISSDNQAYSLATFINGEFFPFEGLPYEYKNFRITHWRYLPKPPKKINNWMEKEAIYICSKCEHFLEPDGMCCMCIFL